MFCQLNKKLLKLIYLLTLLNIAIITTPAYAAQITRTQTIDIQSQYLLLDEKNGISTYEGKVLMQKDTLVIKADTMTLHYNGEKLHKVLISGSPADVRHAPDNEAKVHSQANKMEYLIDEDKLTLTGQAFVNQGNRHFSGESIEYDTRQRIISAAGNQGTVTTGNETSNEISPGSATSQRVHVIIGPDSDTTGADNNDAISKETEIKENE